MLLETSDNLPLAAKTELASISSGTLLSEDLPFLEIVVEIMIQRHWRITVLDLEKEFGVLNRSLVPLEQLLGQRIDERIADITMNTNRSQRR